MAVCQVRMSLHLLLSVKNKPKMKHNVHRLWMHWFCTCFCVHRWQKPEDPKLSPMADNTITRGGTGGLVSLVYICGPIPIQNMTHMNFDPIRVSVTLATQYLPLGFL